MGSNARWHLRHHDLIEHGPYRIDDLIEAGRVGNIVDSTEVRHPKHTRGKWIRATRVVPIAQAMQPPKVSAVEPESPPVAPPLVESQSTNSRPALSLPARFMRPKRSNDDWRASLWDSPGKRIITITTIIWACAAPLAAMYGYFSIYIRYPALYGTGGTKFGHFYGMTYSSDEMAQMAFAEAVATAIIWTTLCSPGWLAGGIVMYLVPKRDQNDSLPTSDDSPADAEFADSR